MHVHVYLYDTFFYSKNYEKINPFLHQLKNITFLLNALFPLKNRIKVHITLVLFILTSIQDAMCLFSWIFNNFWILGHLLKETVVLKKKTHGKNEMGNLEMKSHTCPLIKLHTAVKVRIVWDFMTLTYIIYLTSVQQVNKHLTYSVCVYVFHSCNYSTATMTIKLRLFMKT